MKKIAIFLAAIAVMLFGAYVLIARQAQQAQGRGGGGQQAQYQPQNMSFFVTSTGMGKGADYGGLTGADAYCQRLATAAGSNKTWHAYLSTQGPGTVNARDRIGNGPWLNSRGQRVAMNVADLHGDTIESARLGNNISKATAFTEKNETIMGFGDTTNQHDILTGSQPDGRAYTDAMDHTCNNYTGSSDARGSAVQLGHFDRTGGGNTSWNSAHASRGCSQQGLISTGGAGLLYCFAN